MAQIREIEVTEFTKKLLRDWDRAGRDRIEVERIGRLPKGFATQVMTGSSGVGPKSIPGFALALGYSKEDPTTKHKSGDVMAYRRAAFVWWDAEGAALYEQTRGKVTDPELQKAIDAVRSIGAASDDDIAETLEELKGVTDRDWYWWAKEIGERAKKRFQRAGQTKVARQTRVATRRREKKAAIDALPSVEKAKKKAREKSAEAVRALEELERERAKGKRRSRLKVVT